MFLNKVCSTLPNGFKHSSGSQGQDDHHCKIWKDYGELRPEKYSKGLGYAEDKRSNQGTPHITQSSNGDNKEGFYDYIMIHPQGNAYRRGNQGSTKSGQETAKHESKSKYPAHIDADCTDHLSINSRCTSNFAYFGFV
jgi:hypothetical protein